MRSLSFLIPGWCLAVACLLAGPAPVVTRVRYFPDGPSSPIQAVALDSQGNIYIVGTTSGEIPIVNAVQPAPGKGNCSVRPTMFYTRCPNLFVAKFDPTGTRLIYSTYLGGDESDFAAGLGVDREGNAYIAGTTRPASPFPRLDTGGNAFVKKLSADGSALLYTRYLGAGTSAQSIAVDPGGHAYVAGYNLGSDFASVRPLPVQPSVKSLFVTNDAGRTWRAINNGMPAVSVRALAVDPSRTTTLYAATSQGLYKSLDAGANWTRVFVEANTVQSVVVDPRRPSTVYAIFGSTLQLGRSNDAGATWATLSANFPPTPAGPLFTPVGAFAIDPGDSNILYAAASPNRFPTILKSTDAGDHWETLYTFPVDILQSATLAPQKLIMDPRNSSRLYACCVFDPQAPGTGGVYRSDDGGKTWTRGATGPLGGSAGILSPWLDPDDSNILWGNWHYGLERSTDAGMTWNSIPLPSGLIERGYQPGALALDRSGTLYLLNDFGFMLRSFDRGNSWTRTEGPWLPMASILAMDPVKPSTLYIASGASYDSASLQHAFAAKLDPAGVVQWATLLGGSGQDEVRGIALDRSGNAYITGKTSSLDFPTVNAFQPARASGTVHLTDAFVSKISADGSRLIYSSYLGGNGADSGEAIAVDSAGNAYVGGGTLYGDFPLVDALPGPATGGFYGASFLAKVDAGGSRLLYSTLLTGSAAYPVQDRIQAIVLDAQERPVVAGITADRAFPLIDPIQPTFGIGTNFIARLTASGAEMDFSTYWSELHDVIEALAPGPGGALWAGATEGLLRLDFDPLPAHGGLPLVQAVVNAASYGWADTVAPGEIVTIFGQELAPAAQAAGTVPLPRTMQGVEVSIGGVAVPLFYVSPAQINIQVPVEVRPGSTTLTVRRGTLLSVERRLRVVETAPGIFAAGADVRATPVVVHAADYTLVTEQNPARPGEYLSVFCTGLGDTDPLARSGEAAAGAAPVKNFMSAQFDSGAALFVSYAGVAPGWVGLYQINFRVSENETPGMKHLYFSVGLRGTNAVPVWVR
jgi:uncharacterized protein (TIGR03437 family)